ncbi:oligosaccharide flippase family protein [Niallia taxi]|uniref:lipopolysaccharide biosynthesis protein n=1 Tax=Niallia taxi TaxID=2499688 RepID=UPI003D2A9759
MNNFIKKLFGFSIGPIVGALLAFITIPLTTYFVSPTEYGKASMFTLFQALIVTIIYLGLDQAYSREYHESKDKTNLLKNAMVVPLLLSFIIFIMICLNVNLVSNFLFGSTGYTLASVLFGATIIFMTVERFIMHSIRMEEKALEFSILNVLIKLVILIFTLIFVLFVRRDFLAVVYSAAFGQIAGDVYLVIRYNKYLNYKNFKFDKELCIKLLKFGLPLIVAASLNNLLNSLDRLVLRTWSNFEEIGIFTAALKVAATLQIVQTCFTSFWVPTAYRWNSENKNAKYFEVVSNGLLLAMSILFVLILIFKDFIILLLSPQYMDSKYIIGLLCMQPIMYTISETTTLGIVFSKRSYLNIWVSIIAILPNLILNIILVPKYGAVGAAISTGIAYIFFFLSRSYFSNKHWVGFSLKLHIFVTLILFAAALINTQQVAFINYLNGVFLLLVILIQIPTIKRLVNIYKRKNNNELDFS